MASEKLNPTVLVVFGTTGDLMARKVVPSLFHLLKRGSLPDRIAVVGFGRRDWDDDDLRGHVRAIIDERSGETEAGTVEDFLGKFRYQRGEFDDRGSYDATAALLTAIDAEWGVCSNKLFYLAVPPVHYRTIFGHLSGSGLTEPCDDHQGWTRVLVEKPFGDDYRTARELDELLGSLFREEQIYRIDHYLAKEMLQGVLNFRFSNNLFEAEWGRRAIESIDVTLLESIGAEKRGAFYDTVGALRDVGQNHLLQMLALVTMEQPASLDPDDIRDARAELIESLRPMTASEVARRTFRAQHTGYRDIQGVETGSDTETFFKIRTTMSARRWAGVRVDLESGKRVGQACKRIVVTFRHPDPCLCEPGEHYRNRVVFTMEPSDRIEIVFFAKRPGVEREVEERRFDFFLYEKEEKAQYVEEYAKLLYDAFRGDQTLFVSTREVQAGWRFIDPIIEGWEAQAVPLEMYEPDTADIVETAKRALDGDSAKDEVGICGLGKMGAALARNLHHDGWRVVAWNRTEAVARQMAGEGIVAAGDLEQFVAALRTPRVIWLMVPAGAPVDELLFGTTRRPGLAGLLAAGDTVIDGGNSHYSDAEPRAARLAEHGVHFLDCGTSGGPEGARTGACLMIGGEPEVFERLEPMFSDAAAPGAYRWLGTHGAGHFAKMVHNGIEYGMMQAIAEGFEVLHASPYDFDLADVADLYQQRSVIESRLVGWLAGQYAHLGGDLETVSGIVGFSGEGEWTIEAAKALDVPTPVIEGSLDARVSSAKTPRYAGRVLTVLRDAFGGHGLGPAGGPRR